MKIVGIGSRITKRATRYSWTWLNREEGRGAEFRLRREWHGVGVVMLNWTGLVLTDWFNTGRRDLFDGSARRPRFCSGDEVESPTTISKQFQQSCPYNNRKAMAVRGMQDKVQLSAEELRFRP